MHISKFFNFSVLFYFIFTQNILAATATNKIIEINSFKEVPKYISADSLVLIDIDNTLLTAEQTIGTDQWFGYIVAQNIKNGLDANDAQHEALQLWNYVHGYSKVKLLESETPEILKSIQKSNKNVFVLTARPGNIHQLSEKELNSLNMNFSSNHNIKPLKLSRHGEAVYRDGIISAELTGKGRTLQEFIKLSKFDIAKIKQIVFIDDKSSNIEDIKNTATKLGINYVGLRYSAADADVKSFSSNIADTQLTILKQCGKVIADVALQSIEKFSSCDQFNTTV